jgi:hypothetical protein
MVTGAFAAKPGVIINKSIILIDVRTIVTEFSLKSDSEFTFPYQFQRKFMCSSFTSFAGSEQTLPHV